MRRLLSFLLLITLLTEESFAAQVRAVDDDDEISADISRHEISRIKTAGDLIRKVQANSDEITIVQDDKSGEVYIRPNVSAENKPINLFITTEQNFTYKLLLYPKSIPSEQIILRNDSAVKSSDVEVSKVTKNFYEQQIIGLIRVMRSRKKLEGYTLKQERHYVDLGDLSMRRIITYKGQNFIGEIFTLKNSTNQVVTLEEKMFSKNGVRAVKIEKTELLPGEVTEIFIVS